MPNPQRTWTVSINNSFSSADDQLVQYREALIALKQLFTAAGWTVTRSSNTTTAGAGDNWSTVADIVLGLLGNGSWIVFQSPVAFGSTIEVLLYVDNASGDTTPQAINVRFTAGTYSGGSTTTLPTASVTATAAYTAGRDIIPWTAVLNGRWASWRSSRGDVMFGVKQQGDPQFRAFFMLTSNEDGNGGGQGDYRVLMWLSSVTGGSNVFDAFLTSTNQRTYLEDGTGPFGAVSVTTTALSIVTSLGRDVHGRNYEDRVELWHDGAQARSLGTVVDLHPILPAATASSLLVDGEYNQTLRRVGVGKLLLYMPTASLPLR